MQISTKSQCVSNISMGRTPVKSVQLVSLISAKKRSRLKENY